MAEQKQATEQQIEGALALVPKEKAPIKVGDRGLAFESAAEVFRISEAFVKGNVAPKGSTPGGVMAAILKGRALGLDEVTAMSNITVVNGRVQMGGALVLALIRRQRACAEGPVYWWEGEGNKRAAFVRARRAEESEPTVHRFGLDDAARAGLASKDTYRQWTDDMLLWRAVARMGRRQFSDILAGVYIPGEVQEAPREPSTAPEPSAPPSGPPPSDPVLEQLAPVQEVPTEPGAEDAVQTSPPFASHAEADQAIAEGERPGDLFGGSSDA